MRVAILTFYRALNYGAILQAWSLKTYLEKRGHQVSFVNFSFGGTQRFSFLDILKSRSPRSVLNKLRHNYALSHGFEKSFSMMFPATTKMYNSIEELRTDPPDCDMYIVGSDQMWNPSYCIPYLPVVFLDFGATTVRRISYAASFGSKTWFDTKTKVDVASYLSRFEAISVREKSGIEIVKALCNCQAKWHMDPVFLAARDDYFKLAQAVQVGSTGEKFIFYYMLCAPTDDAEKCLNCTRETLEISSVHDAQMHVTPGGFPWIKSRLGRLSVAMWLKGFETATFVVTNSFHGTVFSIIYRKPFITLLLKGDAVGMNERVVSLLTRLKLDNRLFDSFSPEKVREIIATPINWCEVEERVWLWRKETECFFSELGL